jgi:hypothetical protein
MSLAAVLAPVFVQVALTFFLLIWMGRARFAAIRAGEVKVEDIALSQRAWPPQVLQIANAFHNQNELPILFYTLVGLVLVTRQADLLFVALSWIYVATRLVHSAIYTTSNIVVRRFLVFLAGAIVLMLMWVIFAMRILVAGP